VSPLYQWFSECGPQTISGPQGLAKVSLSLFLSFYHKLQGKNIVENILIFYKMFIWNNGMANILESKLRTGVYTSYLVMRVQTQLRRWIFKGDKNLQHTFL
jgi:hypothetical protein